ncbi:MAG: hypothetical protein P8N40_06020 [Gammaproteobacteria bacterium]|nr:hypothetical protein [Gammaproteobacteria bacterium]
MPLISLSGRSFAEMPLIFVNQKFARVILILLPSISLFSCISNDINIWPDSLPDRQHFVSAYHADLENQLVQSKDQYLYWVINFYGGTLVAPIGWTSMQAIALERADPSQRLELDRSLNTLGIRIASEWSKANNGRAIDSRIISIWGSILQLAFEPETQYRAIQLISNDVYSLLEGELPSSEITDLRYEQKLGLELFSGF